MLECPICICEMMSKAVPVYQELHSHQSFSLQLDIVSNIFLENPISLLQLAIIYFTFRVWST